MAATTTVILLQYVQGETTWTFPKAEIYSLKELFPHPYEPPEGLWEGYDAPYSGRRAD